jgi:hypothetical protein
MKTRDYEKQRVTVALCATADSNKLTPYIVLNCKATPKYFIVRAQQMD